MASLIEPERRDFWEMCEDRYQMRFTIPTTFWRKIELLNRVVSIRAVPRFCETVRSGVPKHFW
jgi:hypothetical protein